MVHDDVNIDASVDWVCYQESVLQDFKELKEKYPFSEISFLPTAKPSFAQIKVIAADSKLVEATFAVKQDFLGAYSKELRIVVPFNYRNIGCKVYGGKWIDVRKLKNEDIHFFHENGKLIVTENGLHMCVGTPESFRNFNNVILENVKTAANMLVAYERLILGNTKKLELKAYSHGDAGRKEYATSQTNYRTVRLSY